ncbi:MAG TPA: hypothetical protein VGD45_07080 [Steroidobacter sp.]|uniref:hypothetical protein n=1 Tax=Steroidobacter sp. TaxID=1978227 RepID=UPI002EDB7E39
MKHFSYLGMDWQLADALQAILPAWTTSPARACDEALIDSLCISDEHDAVAAHVPESSILYVGRFESGSDHAGRAPLTKLHQRAAVLSRPLPGCVVLSAWVRDAAGELKRYQRSCSGVLLSGLRAAASRDGIHWSHLFRPDGFDKPLARIHSSSVMVGKVERLAYDIAEAAGDLLANHVYELHLTVECASAAEFERFRRACAELGIKCIQIILPDGDVQRQTITGSFHRGKFARVVEQAHATASALRDRGFATKRVKLEAMINNPIVPNSPAEAQRMLDSQYFECHVKVAVPPSGPSRELMALCDRHDGHLSRNPSNVLADGNYCVFITQRFFKTTRDSALACFGRMLADLKASGYSISNVMQEYAVLDTNIALDEQWIPHGLVDELLETHE